LNKKRKLFRIAFLLLVLCMVSTVMISGTFAKYTSEYSGQDTALVARWSFNVTETSEGNDDLSEGAFGVGSVELDLFDHAYTNHINQTYGAENYIVAPGVSDSFVIKLDYIADVDADLKITFDELDSNNDDPAVPMEYSVDNNTWVALDDLAEELIDAIVLANAGNTSDPTENDDVIRLLKVANTSEDVTSISHTIFWRWPYEASTAVHGTSSNEKDTELGELSNDAGLTRLSYGISVDFLATQVAPVAPAITSITPISGLAVEGEILTAGVLSPTSATVSYQWLSCATEEGVYENIAGAAAVNTYTIQDTDVTKYIKVQVTGTGSYGGTATSEAIGPVAAAD